MSEDIRVARAGNGRPPGAAAGLWISALFGLLYGFCLAVDTMHFSARPYSLTDRTLLIIEFGLLFGAGSALIAALLAGPAAGLARRSRLLAGRADRAVVFGTVLLAFLGSTLLAGQITAFYWVKHPEITTWREAVLHQALKFAGLGVAGLAVATAAAALSRFARRAWVAILVAGFGLCLALSLGLGRRLAPEHPARPASATALPPVAAAPPSMVPPHPMATAPRKVFLFGIDAVDVRWFEEFMAQGRMPYVSQMWARSSRGPLRTLPLSDTPRVWTTIQTGMEPHRHGVVSHLRWGFPGVSERLSIPVGRKLNFIFDVLARTTGVVEPRPVTHEDARTRKLWEIASDGGLRTTVISYYGTKPVFPLRGTALAHGPQFRRGDGSGNGERIRPADAPSVLYSDLEDFSVPLPAEQDGPALALATLREVMRRDAPDLLGVYVSINDGPGHLKMKYYRPELYGNVDPELIAKHGEDYPRSFERLDAFVREVMALIPDDALTIIVSDHGMEPVLGEHGHSGGHFDGIDGLFMAHGRGVVPGTAPEIRVQDVTPTVLALLGLPPAGDMDGKPVLDFLDPAYRPEPRPEIASYEEFGRPVGSIGSAEHGDMLEQLRALGYVE